MKTPKETISALVREAIRLGIAGAVFKPAAADITFTVDSTKNPLHGDLAANAAFSLAKHAGLKPIETAERLAELCLKADTNKILEQCSPAKPAFVNFTFSGRFLQQGLKSIFEEGKSFGRTSSGNNTRVMVEFVSANPTGPLHVGHGRGAVVGDVVASILGACGFDVWREFYINDSGAQVRNLGISIRERIREQSGLPFELPKDGYHGEYVKELSAGLISGRGPAALAIPDEELVRYGSAYLLDAIKKDLQDFGVSFDRWYPESELHKNNMVRDLISGLKARGLAFDDPSGAVMLKAEAGKEFGDDKDRVLIKSGGDTTYFASDLAYHEGKFQRGFQRLINVWGADHHGYIPRVRAGIKCLGRDPKALDVILVQMVNVLRGGQQIIMSKRSGSFITLREVLDEVGRDAARIVFCMRRPDSQLEFDIELVKRQTMDNPVFYLQYGHARICSILRKAAEAGFPEPVYNEKYISHLNLPEEKQIIKNLLFYPDVLLGCSRTLEPHHLVFYINDLIGIFHGYYTKYKTTERVISDDVEKTNARLMMCGAIKTVLGNALAILGVSAPEKMENISRNDDEH